MTNRALRTIGVKNQLTIPPWIMEEAGIRKGDFLEILPRRNKHAILLRLVRAVPVDEEEYTEGDLHALRKLVDAQLSKGEYTAYKTAEGAMGHVQKLIKAHSPKGKG